MARPPLKASNLRENIKAYGFESGVVMTLELLVDEFAGYRKHMQEMAEIQNQCIDSLRELISVGDGMRLRINELDRLERQHDEARGQGILPTGDT